MCAARTAAVECDHVDEHPRLRAEMDEVQRRTRELDQEDGKLHGRITAIEVRLEGLLGKVAAVTAIAAVLGSGIGARVIDFFLRGGK